MTAPAPMGASGPASPAGDPTAVVGRRFGAAVIDLGILWVFTTVYWFLASERVPGEVSRVLDRAGTDACVGRSFCAHVNDHVLEGWSLGLLLAVWVLYLVGVFVLERGLTGRTVGTMLTGVVVVGEDGRPLGVGRALLRSVAGIVDYLPCCVPIVGIVTSVTTRGHRRVGDMAARSHVVDAARFGQPVVIPEPLVPTGPVDVWSPPPSYPAQPPTPPAAAPPTVPFAPPPGATPAPPPSGDGPVWDAERRAYLQWDPARGQWLQFDQTSGQWHQYDQATGRWRPVDR